MSGSYSIYCSMYIRPYSPNTPIYNLIIVRLYWKYQNNYFERSKLYYLICDPSNMVYVDVLYEYDAFNESVVDIECCGIILMAYYCPRMVWFRG